MRHVKAWFPSPSKCVVFGHSIPLPACWCCVGNWQLFIFIFNMRVCNPSLLSTRLGTAVASLCCFSASCNFYMEKATDTPWMWEFIAQNKCVSQHAFYFASASLPCSEVSGKDISVVHFCSLGPFVLLLSVRVIYPWIFCIIPERRMSAFWKGTLEGRKEGSCFMAMSLQNHIMVFMAAFRLILLRYSLRTFPCVWGREVDLHNALRKCHQ